MLRPHLVGGNPGFNGYGNSNDQRSILWDFNNTNNTHDEDVEVEEEIDLEDMNDRNGLDSKSHRERLLAMKQRTGMHLSAVAREFTASGLPKYGMELSDDEEDEYDETGYPYAGYREYDGTEYGNNYKPALDSIAYDSELDVESD